MTGVQTCALPICRRLGRIAELGCGNGYFLARARHAGWNAIGTESSAVARERLRREGLDVRAPEGWSADLPDASLDAVVMLEVIEHLDDVPVVLRELARLVRPGGRLVLSTPNVNSLTRRLIGARWRIITEEHLWYFSPRTLARVLEAHGFAPRSLESRNVYPPDIWMAITGRTTDRGDRAGTIRAGEEVSQRTGAATDRASGDQPNSRLRTFTAATAPGRWLKRGVNACLRATSLGDTILVMAERSSRLEAEGSRQSPRASSLEPRAV